MQYKEVHYGVHRSTVRPVPYSHRSPEPQTLKHVGDRGQTRRPRVNLESGGRLGSFISLCRQSIGSRGERLGDRRLRLALIEGIEGATTRIIVD